MDVLLRCYAATPYFQAGPASRPRNDAYDLREGDFLVLPGGEPNELAGAGSASAPPVPLLSLLDGTGVEPWKPGVRYRKTLHLRHRGGGSRSVILAGSRLKLYSRLLPFWAIPRVQTFPIWLLSATLLTGTMGACKMNATAEGA